MPVLRLVRWKWLEMITKREALRTARHESSEQRIEHTVRCECGFGREEVDMVRTRCRRFQRPPLLILESRCNVTAVKHGNMVAAMDS